MKILSIDTSSDICSVAILEDNIVLKELHIDDIKTHSEKLMPLIKNIFDECKLSLDNIDLIVCSKGPGSFTGIRIGIATAKAFANSKKIEAIGISSLDGLAYNIENEGLTCSIIDSKNNNVYFGLFENHILKCEYKACSIDEAIEFLKIETPPITFIGNGTSIYKDKILEKLPNSIFIEGTANNSSAIGIGKAAYKNYINNITPSLSPLYLKKSQAERMLEEKKC
ncbi:MAG: tRNA (adenosine(37)-N6)-threonylcarbamoyltransferase complex dimerization subunit type 1 TsaB [Clostridia bacterium]|nr:tRNA (adenosine(37)-N6)-threonylcarbamoyltransferase complex dimerization subunit type 1 TsaB [Clostridia bacterium]